MNATEQANLVSSVMNPTSHSYSELLRMIGSAPKGSHPDEWYPRADTWHQERISWMHEVERLRAESSRLQQRITAIDKAVHDAMVEAVRF